MLFFFLDILIFFFLSKYFSVNTLLLSVAKTVPRTIEK